MRHMPKRLFGRRVRSVQRLSDRKFLAHMDIASAGIRETDAGPVSDLLNHFARRVESDWPLVPSELTDLRMDISRLTQSEVIARADAALEGDIHASGVRPEFRDDGNINWAKNPTSTKEWLLKLNRHAWWPLWGAAYRLTGDEKYARAFVKQLVDWINQHPLPPQKCEHVSAWRLMEVGLRMRISWIPSFGCFFPATSFTDEVKMIMLRSIFDHAQFLFNFRTNRNHLLRESNGLLAVGLCFSEFRDSEDWIREAVERLEGELQAQVNDDGSHIEMSVGYQWLAIDEFEVSRFLLEHFKRRSEIGALDETLKRMYTFLAAVVRPDRSFPQLNDGFILWDSEKLAEVGRQRNWQDIERAGSKGLAGTAPEFFSRSFPNAGLHVMRSDWGEDARYLVMDTGPYGGPHGHEDKLSFELFAYGASFVVDPGSYTYNPDDPYRDYFVGTQGHNTIVVDRYSQVRRVAQEHMTPRVNRDRHGRWESNDAFDFASGVYDEGYGQLSLANLSGATPKVHVRHQRDILFVKPHYWLVMDYLDGDHEHEYSALFHLSPDVLVDKLSADRALLVSEVNGAQLAILGIGNVDIGSEVLTGAESPPQGWYSEDHYKKCAAPALIFSIDGGQSARLIWLLYPLPAGQDAASISAELTENTIDCKVRLEVRQGDSRDVFDIVDDRNARLNSGSEPISQISIRGRGGAWQVG